MTTLPSEPAAKQPPISQSPTDRASTSQASPNMASTIQASTNQSSPTLPLVPDDHVTATPSSVPSAALLAANERLLARRAVLQRGVGPTPDGRSRPSAPQTPMAADVWTRLPPHLGWQSVSVTAVQRRTGVGDRRLFPRTASTPTAAISRSTMSVSFPVAAAVPGATGYLAPAASSASSPPPPATTICLHTSLAMALLRTGQVACGRLWLLLRALDTDGCGCWPLTAVQSTLADRESALWLCGPRRLRQLLQQGNGLFWQRDKTHLWLASAGKVAARLGVARLAGRPVELPLAVLTQSIGLVRAHLYASFHSSRGGKGGGLGGNPISRATLTAVSGVSRRSQHAYERCTRVRVVRNIALGPSLNPFAQEVVTWQHGQAVLILTDRRGKQGRPGRRYLAWQLPNSYDGPHARLGRGRSRRLNRQLVDLCTNGDAGNGRVDEAARSSDLGDRRYARSGGAVEAEGYLRGRQEAARAVVYWQPPGPAQTTAIWYVLSLRRGWC